MASRAGRYIRHNHLGLIAIFIALSGTAWAAATIGPGDIEKNAVRSKHIKAKQVKPGDLSPKLRDGCPQGTDLLSDLCFRETSASRTYFQAHPFCADRGLRVPTFAEASILARNHDLPGVAESTDFWTEEVTGGANALGMKDDGTSTARDQFTNAPVVCVTVPSEGG